jgi:hypothetical protein
MAEQDNVRIVREAYDDFIRGDIQGVLNILADDVEWITPGPPDIMPMAGHRYGRKGVAEFFTALNDVEEVELFEPQDFVAQGDQVVAFAKYRGRVKSTGRSVQSDLVHVFTLRNGKVVQFREYFDTAAVLDAYKPTSAEAAGAS